MMEGPAQVVEAPADNDAMIQAYQDAHLQVDIMGWRGEQGADRGLGDNHGGNQGGSWTGPSFTRMLA